MKEPQLFPWTCDRSVCFGAIVSFEFIMLMLTSIVCCFAAFQYGLASLGFVVLLFGVVATTLVGMDKGRHLGPSSTFLLWKVVTASALLFVLSKLHALNVGHNDMHRTSGYGWFIALLCIVYILLLKDIWVSVYVIRLIILEFKRSDVQSRVVYHVPPSINPNSLPLALRVL